MTFLHSHVVSLCQAVKQRLRQWTRPHNHALILNTALDLTRSKPELVLENALLRQQLIILQRLTKRPKRAKLSRVRTVHRQLTPRVSRPLHHPERT